MSLICLDPFTPTWIDWGQNGRVYNSNLDVEFFPCSKQSLLHHSYPCQQFQSSWRVKSTLCPVFLSGYGKKVRRALKNAPSIEDIYFELCFLQNRCTLGLYRTPLKKTSTGSCRKCRREPNSSGTRPRKAEKTMFRYKHYTIFPFIFSHRHTHSNAAQWKALGEADWALHPLYISLPKPLLKLEIQAFFDFRKKTHQFYDKNMNNYVKTQGENPKCRHF